MLTISFKYLTDVLLGFYLVELVIFALLLFHVNMVLEYQIDQISQAVKEVLSFKELKKILVFEAEMGAGKTTFISQIIKQLGSKDQGSSPTFAIVNQYEDQQNNPMYHFLTCIRWLSSRFIDCGVVINDHVTT